MKIEKASDEVIDFVKDVVNSTTLNSIVSYRVLNNENQKQLVVVKRATPTAEYFADCEYLILIYVNEALYDLVDEKTRRLLFVDAINTVSFDFAKDKIIIKQPQINITIDGYRMYGEELVNAYEACCIAFEQLKSKEKNEQ